MICLEAASVTIYVPTTPTQVLLGALYITAQMGTTVCGVGIGVGVWVWVCVWRW